MNRTRVAVAAAAFLLLTASLAACAPTVALDPAPDAADPACADVTVHLPDEIDENGTKLPQRETNAQATGAWGDPTAVVLHCGVAAPPATSDLPCPGVPGVTVDWLLDDSQAPEYRFTTYDRTPAVSVVVDYDVVSGTTVLEALDVAVSGLPENGHHCIDAADVPSATPIP